MKTTTIAIACALLLALPDANAHATELTIGDAYFVGTIVDSIPSNAADEAKYIEYLITLGAGALPRQLPGVDPENEETYDRIGSTLADPLPGVEFLSATKVDGPDDLEEWDPGPIDVTGVVYILAKYDASGAGALVWLVNGVTDDNVRLPTEFNNRQISHYTLFTTASVPDGGMTLMLLGGALVGLGALRRRFNG